MKPVSISITSALLLLAASSLPAALSLESYDPDSHHRFANPADPTDFIGNDHNWSGVALSSTSSRWVTMISPTYFVTATHTTNPHTASSPLFVGHNVVFHADNDPDGPTVTRSVTSLTLVGTTDIMIGRLASTPGPTIATYGIAMDPTTSATFGSSVYSDRVAFIVGFNSTGSGTAKFRVGRNELDGFIDSVDDGSSMGSGITFDDDRFTLDSLGADEAYIQGGDSGAPLFVTSGDELILVGTNWFQDTDPDPNRSGATFLPNHIAAISAIVTSGGESITLVNVPEPSSMFLLAFGGVALIRRRR